MGLPSPSLSVSIPSIYDDTTLDFRVYHPTKEWPETTDAEGKCEKRKLGAIVAHPYAPLGGCYDDPVVGIVANQILKEDFVVCTFNFRYFLLPTGHWAEAKDPQRCGQLERKDELDRQARTRRLHLSCWISHILFAPSRLPQPPFNIGYFKPGRRVYPTRSWWILLRQPDNKPPSRNKSDSEHLQHG